MRSRLAFVLGLTAAGLALATGAAAQTAAVTIASELSPRSLSVPPGTTVTWQNNDGAPHRLRSTSGPSGFDSAELRPFDTFSYEFTSPGRYEYRDELRPADAGYHGTIIVTSTASTADPVATAGEVPRAGGATGRQREPAGYGAVAALVVGIPVGLTIFLAFLLRKSPD